MYDQLENPRAVFNNVKIWIYIIIIHWALILWFINKK